MIGTIGGSGDENTKPVTTPANGGGYDTPSDHVSPPHRERQDSEKDSWEKPVENAREDLAEPLIQNVATDDSIDNAASTTEAPPTGLHDPGYRGYSFLRIPPSKRGPLTERAAQIEAILRRHRLEYPQDWKSRRDVGEGSIFDDLDFAPSYWEVHRVDGMISRINPGEDIPPPLEEAPVMETKSRLRHVLPLRRNGYAYDERDPAVLIDAVAATNLAFFVPTLAEMMEAMRQMGLEPAPVYSESEDRMSPRTSGCAMSEVEEAIRRAQRAPRMSWPENIGLVNEVQEWVRRRGYHVREESRILRDISSFLQEEGYLASEPSSTEVSEAMDKLVAETQEAAARHRERKRRRDIEARIIKIAGMEKETRARYPKRIAELVNSLRTCLGQRPKIIELDQDYDDRGLEQAAREIYSLTDFPLTPEDFTREEAEEALGILLVEKEIQQRVLMPTGW